MTLKTTTLKTIGTLIPALLLCVPVVGASAASVQPTPPVSEEPQAQAQEPQEPQTPTGDDQHTADTDPDARPLTASELNARQRIHQTVTVKRRINGILVEEKSVEVPHTPGAPIRKSESGTTLSEIIRARIDREVLTRREALAEADIDFTIADINSNNAMTKEEFTALWLVRRDDENYQSFFSTLKPAPRAQVPEARVPGSEISPAQDAENPRIIYGMAEKFSFMSGIKPTMTRRDYIVEVLRDFDSMDANGDYILRDDELKKFRATALGL